MIEKTSNEWVTCKKCKRPKHIDRVCICEKEHKPQEEEVLK